MHGMCFAMLTPILYISGCRKIHGVQRGKGFALVLMVCSIALDEVYATYSACGKAFQSDPQAPLSIFPFSWCVF